MTDSLLYAACFVAFVTVATFVQTLANDMSAALVAALPGH